MKGLIILHKTVLLNEAIDNLNIKEDGILSVVYLITPEKDQITDLFTMVKYTVYFIKETLSNYIGKYIRDMIFDFCHLPSDCLSDFLAHLGALCKRNKKQSNKSKIIFPLKKYIKSFLLNLLVNIMFFQMTIKTHR